MTILETEVVDEFDLDVQIDDTTPPARKYDHRAQSQTLGCSCSGCCPTQWCAETEPICSMGCN